MPRTRADLRPEPTAPVARRRPRWRLPLVLAVAAALAAVGLWGRLPDPRGFLDALTGARPGWVTLAVVLQAASLAAFAWQQRDLLRALGVRVKARQLMAVTLARTAISISLPAGAAVSAAYAVREYQRAGSTREIAAASMIVSGLASIGGLTLLYLAGGLFVLAGDPSLLLSPRPLAVVAALIGLTTAAVLLGRRTTTRRTRRRLDRLRGRLFDRARALIRSARDAWRAGAALRARDWSAAVVWAAVNWLTDLLCLAVTCRAVGLPVGVLTLAGIYLGVQIVRQVPLTPGGVGVIDTALVAGLTAAGATAVTAAAAVLLYRLLSCWLLIPAGGLAALHLRRRAALV